jgi:hypothetical protein
MCERGECGAAEVGYEECACGSGEGGEGLGYDDVAHVVHGDCGTVEDGGLARLGDGWCGLEGGDGLGEGCECSDASRVG